MSRRENYGIKLYYRTMVKDRIKYGAYKRTLNETGVHLLSTIPIVTPIQSSVVAPLSPSTDRKSNQV